jgi:dolichol-phosphate mannosyltransferase
VHDTIVSSFINLKQLILMLYSVILPTYNERENLPIIFFLIDKYLSKASLEYEVVIVDDSSPDGTLSVAKAIQESFGERKVTIVSRKGKLGLGTAYAAGLKASKGDRIILMDADLSHHPKFIPEMVRQMDQNGVDIVTGSRYIPGGGVYGWDLFRKLTSRTANFLADFLLNPKVSDLTGSFRLYERKTLEHILPLITCTGYAFQMEIIVRARNCGMEVSEVPISFVDRIYGESKLGTKEILLYLKGLMHLFFTT